MPEPAHDSLVRDFLATTDAACPACGYGLRGVPEAKCPECAAPLHLEIASGTRTGLGPWLIAVISYALGLGFDGVMGLLFSVVLIMQPPPPGFTAPYILLAVFVTGAVGCAFFLLLTIRRRRRWLASSRPAQWRAGVAVFLIVALIHAAVGGYFLSLVI